MKKSRCDRTKMPLNVSNKKEGSRMKKIRQPT